MHKTVPTTIFIAAAMTLAITACTPPSPDKSTVLVTVNGQPITEKDYENFLQLRQQRQAPEVDKAKEKQVVLDEMIERLLLAEYAEGKKLDQELEVYFVLKRVRENVLAQAAVRETLKNAPITDEDLKKRYEQEIATADKTEYKVRHILVKDEATAADVIKRLKAGAKFDALAKQKSIDTESAKKGGDLGEWITKEMVVPEFYAVLPQVKKGQFTDTPVKSQYGYHVIMVVDSRPRQFESFEQFIADPRRKANLSRLVQEARINDLVKSLKDKAKINKS